MSETTTTEPEPEVASRDEDAAAEDANRGEAGASAQLVTPASSPSPEQTANPAAGAPDEVTAAPAPAVDEAPDGAPTSAHEMEAVLEAILFVAGEPQPRERLLELFGRQERAAAETALQAVLDRYRGGEGRGMMVEEVAGGVRLVSRPELHTYLRRFFQVSGRGRLSMAALETLAIIAYRQPLTGPEIGDLRGVQSTAVIKTLLERRLIRIAGRKQVVGKPFLYATTREFLLHFGLGTLGDLPPLEEMEELFTAEGGGEAAGPADREEEVLRANAELDARDDAREEEGE